MDRSTPFALFFIHRARRYRTNLLLHSRVFFWLGSAQLGGGYFSTSFFTLRSYDDRSVE
jgi:hypothetical protein